MAQQMSPMLLQSFNDEAMKKMFEQSFNFYPQKAVKAGDSWTGNFSLAIAGISSDSKNTYTLKSIKNNTAVIDVVSVASGDLAGNATGETTLDIKTGMPTSSVSTQTIKNGKLNMQGVEITMDTETKSSMILQKQ